MKNKKKKTKKKKKKIKIYTSIFGNKDNPRDDIKCFTGESDNPLMAAKKYKILAHKYIDADYSIWVDGNIKPLVDKEVIVNEFLGDNDIAVWEHFLRDCIYDEASACIHFNKGKKENIIRQVKYYREQDYPEHNGMGECNVIVRRHNDKVKKFNEDWWEQIQKFSCRDQISFPYVLWKSDIKCNFVKGEPRTHPYFYYKLHNFE